MKIGLTGGIGCGKSTALTAFKNNNFATLSADALGHKILDSVPAREFVAENFGENCIRGNAIDHATLAQIIFADSVARERLENFIHPRIEAAWAEVMKNTNGDIAVEIPLLFEKNYAGQFDKTICIACSRETQLARLAARGLAGEKALARIAAQLPLEEKIRRADVCLFNDGSEAFLKQQISILIKRWRENAPETL